AENQPQDAVDDERNLRDRHGTYSVDHHASASLWRSRCGRDGAQSNAETTIQRYPRWSSLVAVCSNAFGPGTSKPRESAMRSYMLKSAQTCTASSIASSPNPTARSGSTSAVVRASGSSVSFSRNPSVARDGSLTGAVRQLSSTASTSSLFPSAFDATAP